MAEAEAAATSPTVSNRFEQLVKPLLRLSLFGRRFAGGWPGPGLVARDRGLGQQVGRIEHLNEELLGGLPLARVEVFVDAVFGQQFPEGRHILLHQGLARGVGQFIVDFLGFLGIAQNPLDMVGIFLAELVGTTDEQGIVAVHHETSHVGVGRADQNIVAQQGHLGMWRRGGFAFAGPIFVILEPRAASGIALLLVELGECLERVAGQKVDDIQIGGFDGVGEDGNRNVWSSRERRSPSGSRCKSGWRAGRNRRCAR